MLESSEDLEFLSDITEQIKAFYETAVIFITRNDFSDQIFNTLCSIRAALQAGDKNRLIDVIVEFHLQWLRAISEIEQFMRDLSVNYSRDKVYKSICFTIDAMGHRLEYYHNYMEKCLPDLSNEDQANLLTDLEIVEEMNKDVTAVLLGKLKCFKNNVGFDEFKIKVLEAIDELLTWIDTNYDGLAIRLSNYMHVTSLEGNLTKTLQRIVNDLISDKSNPATAEILNLLKKKGKSIGSLVRRCAGHRLELSKVSAKINYLEETIKKLADVSVNAPLLAFLQKKRYLENRVAKIEKLKTTLECIHNLTGIDMEEDIEECSCLDFYQLKVFNHVLPVKSRERLVTDLCRFWDLAVIGQKSHQSVISILSAAANKEEFTDELGTFYIDQHSRKIYTSPEDSETLMQPNEHGELVPISDDLHHIYYYDNCGRYYIEDTTREKIYKARASSSEYKMDSTGMLLKVKEVKDGTEYYYDHCGRYYINDQGKHIYRDEGHLSEYENDELGNIVRIRSQLDIFQPCPDDEHVSEDFKYLKQTVGPALRVCIADLLLHQPADPIKYLSTVLVKFRENMQMKDTLLRDKEELNAQREIIAAEARAEIERLAMEGMTRGGSEASYDSNLVMYTSMHPDAAVSVGAAGRK